MRLPPILRLGSFPVLLLFAGLWLSLSAPASAAPAKAPPTAAALGKEKKAALPQVLDVAVNKSVSVALSAPASTVFIANPEIADVQVATPTRIMVLGKSMGETTLIVSDERGAILAQKSIVVSPQLSELRAALKALSPEHPIKVEAVPNGLILSGEVADATLGEEARRIAARYVPPKDGDIINRIRLKANNQVMIRVRFAEVSREVDKRLGLDWENIGQVGSFTLGLATGPDFFNAATGAITRTTMNNDLNDALSVGARNSHFNINAMVDALAKDGLVTILAEPSLTAMSGETASFLAGGEFPVPIPQSGDTITIEWKQYGVSLAFTPTIVGSGRINLHVRPEVSQLTDVGAVKVREIDVPALTTRRAETTIELGSGQSFALAGLLNNRQNQAVSKFPFLGDIPVLGPLFRSTRFQNNESELVLIITPYIVKPTTPDKISLPTDRFAPPSDVDFNVLMRPTSSDPQARTISGPPPAVSVSEPPAAETTPAPLAAPSVPVVAAPTPAAEETATLPLSKPLPASPKKAAPAGPGGFMME